MGLTVDKRFQLFSPGVTRTVGDLVTCADVRCGRQSRSHAAVMGRFITSSWTKLRTAHRAYLVILTLTP